jgi:histidinol phosphatase-like PHP family hydrolase
MKPLEILQKNHDLHLHSRDYSDGKHTMLETARYAARYQQNPRWVGISDHSGSIIQRLMRAGKLPGGHEHGYPDDFSGYTERVREVDETLKGDGLRVLAGIEQEWGIGGPRNIPQELSQLDYIITAYHQRRLTTPYALETYYYEMACHPTSDIAAHPGWFTGCADPAAIPWQKIFRDLADHAVLCEYNLTTPLPPAAFEIAVNTRNLIFTIGSDLHDFRQNSTLRICSAWSETNGGGFSAARGYLNDLVNLTFPAQPARELQSTFASIDLLTDLESRLYNYSLGRSTAEVAFSALEWKLVQYLDQLPWYELDDRFIQTRLARFADLPEERIASLLPIADFLALIARNRRARASR